MKMNSLFRMFCPIYGAMVMLVSAVSFPVHADEFEDMKAEMSSEMAEYGKESDEFDAYQDQIENEFEAYRKIVDEEYKNYRNEILKYWNKPEMTQKKKFVEYSPDMKSKKVVDFENERITISVIMPKGTKPSDIQKDITEKLEDLVAEDSAKAFERDTFAQKVEDRISKVAPDAGKDNVKKVPVITDIVTGTSSPSKKQVTKAVEDLKKKAEIKTQPSDKVKDADVVTVTIKLPSGAMGKKAETYKAPVEKNATERGIDPALVLAVMHTESAFNPMARSYVPAYGLMQIVPKSAGLDASKEVFGEEKLLTPSYLYNGDNNITMGTAYLYILNNRYLKSIKNERSRLYCVISAYNTGAGNVARAFTGKTNISRAAKVINSMTPDEVYNKLMASLPYDETKDYLKRVNGRMDHYR